jgi:glycerol-3-phosphate acyltransferase PlsX
MRIAVDAMGGDHGPSVIVNGALEGARASGCELILVGRTPEIEQVLPTPMPPDIAVEIIHAPDVIDMEEHPAQAARRKPGSSINIALGQLKEHRADAMVSAGNSGAVMAAALMILGRIDGIDRPAIAAFLPTLYARTLMLDLGAVTDPKPHHLVQFARMGAIYARLVLQTDTPKVGLLSNGEEPTKGNHLIQEVFPLLAIEPAINFVGNIEGKDILRGVVDVLVADGFTGNVAIKVAEGTASMLTDVLREEMTRSWPRKLAALALKPAFQSMKRRLDYAEIGGAPLLGVNGEVLIAHGRSNERAIANAVIGARKVAEEAVREAIRQTASAN